MSEWKEIELDNIAELVKDKYTPQKGDKLHYIGLEHIQEQSLRLKGLGNSDEITSDKFHFNSGDILFGKLRPYLRKVIIPKFDGVCSTDIWVVRSKIQKYDINQRYLFYLFASKEFVDLSDSSASGTRMPRADWKFMRNTIWDIPINETEQKTIADFLDRKTEQIDTLTEKKQQQIELLKEQRTAIINQAVTKGLNPDVTMKDSGWPMIKLYKLCKLGRGFAFKSSDYINEGILNFRVTNIGQNGYPDLSNAKYLPLEFKEKYNQYLLYDDDFVIVMVGATTGKIGKITKGILPALLNQNMWRFFPNSHMIHKNFLYLLVKNLPLLKQGSARDYLKQSDFLQIEIPLPPLPEQRAIADYLDRKTEQIDLGIKSIQSQIRILKEYRTALITNAVTGTIDIRNEVAGVKNAHS